MMADQYAYTRDGYVERTPHYRYEEPQMRRFTIRQRGGRLVIEEL